MIRLNYVSRKTGKYLGEGSYKVTSRGLIIGRGSTANIKLRSPYVSVEHALLYTRGGNYYIRDLGSKNGVYVNGRKVQESVLREGDKVWLGDYEITISESPVEERPVSLKVAFILGLTQIAFGILFSILLATGAVNLASYWEIDIEPYLTGFIIASFISYGLYLLLWILTYNGSNVSRITLIVFYSLGIVGGIVLLVISPLIAIIPLGLGILFIILLSQRDVIEYCTRIK